LRKKEVKITEYMHAIQVTSIVVFSAVGSGIKFQLTKIITKRKLSHTEANKAVCHKAYTWL